MLESQNPAELIVGALTIGEYGKIVDLSGEARVVPTVQRLFQSPQEDVKFAASVCMGNISIGNPSHFLDKVFQLIGESQEAQKYLFLNTIKEIIIADSHCLEEYLFTLIGLLHTHTSAESLQIRNIVAEIMGRLLADFPDQMFDTVDDNLRSGNNLSIATTARAIKFAGSRMKGEAAVMKLKLLSESLYTL